MPAAGDRGRGVFGSPGTVLLYARRETHRLGASYARAFAELGWRVVPFDADPAGGDLGWWLRSRLGRRLTRRCLPLRRRGSRRRNRALLEVADRVRPDLALLISGQLVMPETVSHLRDSGIPVAVLHPDAPVPGNSNHRPEHGPLLQQADVTFIWSRRLAERLEEAGAPRVVYLPFGWDPVVFPHVEDAEADGPDVVFVGGWDRYREEQLEPVAERFDLEVWGPDYWGTRTRRGSPLREAWRGRPLRGRAAARAVASARIALNVLREQNLTDGTNMRTFEIPGAGGFQLATRTSGAEEIFPEGEAAAYFGSTGELLEQIERYLEDEEARARMARRGHAIAERSHRYVHRAERILTACGLAGGRRAPGPPRG